jgi:hypothetical protein
VEILDSVVVKSWGETEEGELIFCEDFGGEAFGVVCADEISKLALYFRSGAEGSRPVLTAKLDTDVVLSYGKDWRLEIRQLSFVQTDLSQQPNVVFLEKERILVKAWDPHEPTFSPAFIDLSVGRLDKKGPDPNQSIAVTAWQVWPNSQTAARLTAVPLFSISGSGSKTPPKSLTHNNES